VALWSELKAESARQEKSVYETSSMLSLSAVRALPHRARWLGTSAAVGAARAGQVLSATVLEQYRVTLREIRQVGYTEYATRQVGPYVRAAASQFKPGKSTLTGRLLERRTRKST
jgi:hypothetical protein